MKWHYIYEDEIISKTGETYWFNGTYMVYHKDMYDKLLNDKDFVHQNDAFDEHEYLLDCSSIIRISYDGKLIYVPNPEILFRYEISEALDYESEEW